MSDLNRAIVKHNLWEDDEDLPGDFCVGGYAAAGKYKKKGRNDYKERNYAGVGVGHFYDHGVEVRGPNAAAGFEKTKHRVKADAEAQVLTLSMSNGLLGVKADVLKADAKFQIEPKRLQAKVEAKVAEISAKAGPVKATAAVAATTGFNIDEGVEVQVLGTGVRIGREIGFSVLGTGVSIDLDEVEDLVSRAVPLLMPRLVL